MNNRQSGFTLIELLVVIFIIAIVAASALYALNPARRIGESNDARRKTELESVARAVELYTADHGSAPTDIAYAGIVVGSKYVLCSSAGTLTCGSQTLPCRVISSTDFLGTYLPALPVDPTKSSTADTGYYVTRSNNNTLILGSCSTYSGNPVEIAARVNLPTYVTACADGIVGGSEVCDYTSTACPNNASYRYTGYAYDGVTCTSSTYACNTSCNGCINQASCLGTCDSGGVYSGGYCWYVAPDDSSSCTAVCSTHGSCTVGTWNDDASCTIAAALGISCTSCTGSATNKAPAYDSVSNGCYYRSGGGNAACSGNHGISDFRRICACNK